MGTAGSVIAEDAPGTRGLVVADKQRERDEALHGHAQVLPDHAAEAIGLAAERQAPALHFLVMLKLYLEEPHHGQRDAPRAGDADRRELVAAEHLLGVALGDHVAHR